MQPDPRVSRSALVTYPATRSPVAIYLPLAIVLISNLIPLAGVLYWGWSTFVLLMLYWTETAIIAFWTLMRILIGGDFGKNIFSEITGRLFFFTFFLVHSSGFMLGHFIFLWSFFSGQTKGNPQLTEEFFRTMPVQFWDGIIVANGLLLPLAISFIGRGIAFVIEMARLPLWKRLVDEDNAGGTKPGPLVGGLYTRIIIMHLVILAGAALAQKFGSLAPLILLIAAKTFVDIWLFVKIDLKDRAAAPAN
ncbi:MAG: hypothetical protein KIT65_12260 [Xanthobacteraceae bacterium]|nr:hypothetical protein [Xanthobacteraceae bacterium]